VCLAQGNGQVYLSFSFSIVSGYDMIADQIVEERNMTLKEIRQQWEEDAKALLTLTSPSQEVYTLVKGELKDIQGQWHVFRYSRSGSSWQDRSVVASHFPDMEHALEYLNTEFAEFYPDGA
jgi:hypothetical protein